MTGFGWRKRSRVRGKASFTPDSLTTSVCLILSFLAAPRILRNGPDVLRRFRALSHLRKAQNGSLLPRQGRKDLRRLLRHRAVSHDRLPAWLRLRLRRSPLLRRPSAFPARGHSLAR